LDTHKEQENYPLDDSMIEILAEANQQIAGINQRLQGALILFLRQHKLEGNWQVAPNGKELVKQAATEVRT
jgi:hypothetical protein